MCITLVRGHHRSVLHLIAFVFTGIEQCSSNEYVRNCREHVPSENHCPLVNLDTNIGRPRQFQFLLASGSRFLPIHYWLEHKFSDRKVRGSNPTSASRLSLSRLGQSGNIPDLVLLSGGMAAKY
ncbi:hypothetical protein T265_02636 [Opisthorchis viverrini]|uniref:Secreted protein n=1 Tax=Opisthorchis viverrini TaxID=6198 RepID=A0A075AI61_OPIVI|nr:hypothetical protein T265_02636 [Opisthorchis viverrini]KER31074.1 hypothetical protein T265_02636 [Opisthorchis viverrini]